MTAKREPKAKKHRGGMSHGYGHKKKHRGAGSRGGRGQAGTGKRADVKKPSIGKNYFGKYGFTSKHFHAPITAITIQTIQEKLPAWTAQGKASEKGGVYTVDLGKLGINKLLARGKVHKKLSLTVDFATPGSIERVKAAGGSVEGLLERKEKPAAEPAEVAPAEKETEPTA